MLTDFLRVLTTMMREIKSLKGCHSSSRQGRVHSSSNHSHPFLDGKETRAPPPPPPPPPALGRRARRGLAQRHDRRGGMGDHQLNPDHDRQLVEYLRFLRRKRDTAIAEVAAEFKEVNESRLFEESYSADEVANILEGLLTSACARRSRRHPAHTKAGTTAA